MNINFFFFENQIYIDILLRRFSLIFNRSIFFCHNILLFDIDSTGECSHLFVISAERIIPSCSFQLMFVLDLIELRGIFFTLSHRNDAYLYII